MEEEKYIAAIVRTLNFLHPNYYLCPKCGEYVIIDGFVCFGCGYDKYSSKRVEEENE